MLFAWSCFPKRRDSPQLSVRRWFRSPNARGHLSVTLHVVRAHVQHLQDLAEPSMRHGPFYGYKHCFSHFICKCCLPVDFCLALLLDIFKNFSSGPPCPSASHLLPPAPGPSAGRGSPAGAWLRDTLMPPPVARLGAGGARVFAGPLGLIVPGFLIYFLP